MALADGYEHLDECVDGCVIAEPIEVDGRLVEVHHWIPDDFAAHAPTSECGCKPVLHAEMPGKFLLYEHFDQDTAGDDPWSEYDTGGVLPERVETVTNTGPVEQILSPGTGRTQVRGNQDRT